MAKLDLMGRKINHLTVLRPTEERNKSGCVMWLCRCDCGNEIKVASTILNRQKIQSCGCERTKQFIAQNKDRVKDLTGQRFGALTVIEQCPERSSDKQVIWLCQCDCGNIVKIKGGNLRTGNTKSCGCLRNQSYGEEKIRQLLKLNNIAYEHEKTFDDCRFKDTNMLARFDFYLPELNTIIEYDGKQHSVQGTGNFDNPEKFKKTQEHDLFKTSWCKEHKITLIRIPFGHYSEMNIKDLLPQSSKFIVGD